MNHVVASGDRFRLSLVSQQIGSEEQQTFARSAPASLNISRTLCSGVNARTVVRTMCPVLSN
jgi:hypothetical protein